MLVRGVRALVRFSLLPALALCGLGGPRARGPSPARRARGARRDDLRVGEPAARLQRYDGPSESSRWLAGKPGAVLVLPLGDERHARDARRRRALAAARERRLGLRAAPLRPRMELLEHRLDDEAPAPPAGRGRAARVSPRGCCGLAVAGVRGRRRRARLRAAKGTARESSRRASRSPPPGVATARPDLRRGAARSAAWCSSCRTLRGSRGRRSLASLDGRLGAGRRGGEPRRRHACRCCAIRDTAAARSGSSERTVRFVRLGPRVPARRGLLEVGRSRRGEACISSTGPSSSFARTSARLSDDRPLDGRPVRRSARARALAGRRSPEDGVTARRGGLRSRHRVVRATTCSRGTRPSEGVPADLLAQFHPAEDAARAWGSWSGPWWTFEADDALATGAHRYAALPEVEQVVICSPDKDLRAVRARRAGRSPCDRHAAAASSTRQGSKEKFGVRPASIPDWLALVGDDAEASPACHGGAPSRPAGPARPLPQPRRHSRRRGRVGRSGPRSRLALAASLRAHRRGGASLSHAGHPSDRRALARRSRGLAPRQPTAARANEECGIVVEPPARNVADRGRRPTRGSNRAATRPSCGGGAFGGAGPRSMSLNDEGVTIVSDPCHSVSKRL